MALKVFKLPGGEGGLRKPYLMPTDAEVERFTSGLLALGLAEIDELAGAAGLGQVRSHRWDNPRHGSCVPLKPVMGHASWVMRALKTRQGSGVSGQA